MSATINRLARMFGSRAAGTPLSLRCSFCGRSAKQVDRLVAGASAYICDACIAKCVAVLEDHGGMQPAGPRIQ